MALNTCKVSPKVQHAALTIDPTGGKFSSSGLKNFCESLDVSHIYYPYPIFEIMKIRNEGSPCSFCANMRRGILSGIAKDRDLQKLPWDTILRIPL